MENVISISNLSKSFGLEKAVDQISFDVHQGDIFAFLGSNGSGKTTTIRCLLNIYKPDSGKVMLFNQTYDNSLANKIGYLPEERGLYTKAKLNDVFIYFTMLRGINRGQAQKLTDEYLEKVGLLNDKNKFISQLSSGMQQKVQIGIAVIHKPKLLILDEPFKGLDPVNRETFLNLFTEMKNNGTSILYSTHVIDEAQKLSNRLIIIKKGKTKAYGSVEEVRNSFGKNFIHIESNSIIAKDPTLFELTNDGNNYTLAPNSGVSTNQILNSLLSKKVNFTSFKIDAPNLNEIFIELTKKKDE